MLCLFDGKETFNEDLGLLTMSMFEMAEVERRFVPNCVAWDRLTQHAQGSPLWHDTRSTTIGSSEAAAVFPGKISKTVTPADLRRKLRGEPRPLPSAYLQKMFDEGAAMEPVLRQELEDLLHCRVVETGIFVQKTPEGEPNHTASLDGIALRFDRSGKPYVLLTEFKWRCGEGAGWGDTRDRLGITVWCQVQHQMRVANVPVAVVYSGARCGERRLWFVKQAPQEYTDMWHAWLKKTLEASRAHPDTVVRERAGTSTAVQKTLYRFMLVTIQQFKVPSKCAEGGPQLAAQSESNPPQP